jgi:hypothetical protein
MLQAVVSYTLLPLLDLAWKGLLPISHHFQKAETFTLRKISLKTDSKRYMSVLDAELGSLKLKPVRECFPLRTESQFQYNTSYLSAFSTGRIIHLQ